MLYAGWLKNLPRFQGARPDHVRVESSCCCFASFVRQWGVLANNDGDGDGDENVTRQKV